MSNLESKFYVFAGLIPKERSALQVDIEPKSGESPVLEEGMVVAVEDQSGTAVVSKHTSTAVSGGQPPDAPWLVIRGSDQSDAATSNTVTCLRMGTGMVFQVETAESFTIGDLCRADGGAIKPLTVADEQAVGQIIGVDSANGTVVVSA